MPTARILLIEDDPMISRSLSLSLGLQNYAVTCCDSYGTGLPAASSTQCDLVLLDVNLPDGDGIRLCREVRRREPVLPILILTANVDEASAVRGIEAGADDYIRKPFGVQELSARIRRVLGKRSSRQLQFGDLRLEIDQHKAWVDDQQLSLGKREFAILSALVERAGHVVSRQEILDVLDQHLEVYDRTIDSHMSHIRRKLKHAGAIELIVPVYGIGYRLELT